MQTSNQAGICKSASVKQIERATPAPRTPLATAAVIYHWKWRETVEDRDPEEEEEDGEE